MAPGFTSLTAYGLGFAILFLALTFRAPGDESSHTDSLPAPQSPDFFETYPDGSRPVPATGKEAEPPGVSGPIAPAAGQPEGALSGRLVFTSGGHGWTYNNDPDSPLAGGWITQRGVNNEICEDFGNLDQMTMFAFYCFNAGATVVTFRPVGHQTNEVVLDNDAAAVTFSGSWSDSVSTIYYGSAGDVPYRFASLAATETATATYTPNIPVAGFYPVYTWVRHGNDRTSQLYRIRHMGGESRVRVPHYLVGNGWVYLGSYYFNAGSNSTNGAVVISNLQPTPSIGTVVIADAIRFGNGMGSIVPTPKDTETPTTSSYPREEECSRYWVQKSLGQGQSSSLYNQSGLSDQDDNVGTPPRMAAEMNSTTTETNIFKRVYVGFHSNAGGGRGCVGLVRSDSEKTPNQQELARLLAKEIDDDLTAVGSPPLEVPWDSDRAGYTISGIYGEINNSVINGEMDATIIEVAFHDQVDDSKILRDPKGRNWIARAVYQGVIRYFNEFDSLPLDFLPEPPGNVRAIAATNGITISWSVPVAQGGSDAAMGYVVYRSTDGYGFGNPTNVSGGGTLSLTMTDLAVDTDFYFRVAATNAGGESFPSETVGCRRSSNPAAPRALFVNGFDRFDRTLELRQTPAAQSYDPPDNSGSMVRVIPRTINSFDYVVQHGKALDAFGMAFDSCQNEAITNNQIQLTNYPIVLWACGNESTDDQTFNSIERSKITAFLAGGGNLFVSGAEIAWDLDRPSGPSNAERNFLHNQLHAAYTNDDSGGYVAGAATGSIFDGRNTVTMDDGTKGIYWVQAPDVIVPYGAGATVAMNYTNGAGAAAVQYDGSAGGGKVVYFGFPFETITSATRRNNYLANVLAFFAPDPPAITGQPQSQAVKLGADVTFAVTNTGTTPFSYQWRLNTTNLAGATNASFLRTNAQPADAGNYSVSITNVAGAVTSSNALLTVNLPLPVLLQSIAFLSVNQLQLVWSGDTGSSYAIEASTNMMDWVTVTNQVNTNGTFGFTDLLTTNFTRRFYRTHWLSP